MNKTENVSIGRKGFVCDVDAYKLLDDYLVRSAEALDNDPDKDEILADLESSMAGHLHEMSGDLVIDRQTAKRVIELMGEVEVDGSQPKTHSHSHNEDADTNEDLWRRIKVALKKPIKKDRKRAIGDGVCAGIAKAVDIDPLWIRILFVVLTVITQGAFVIVYLVLSVIMKDDGAIPKRKASEVVDSIKSKFASGENATIREYERVGRSIVVGLIRTIWAVLKVVVCTVLVAVSIAWASVLIFMLTNPSQVDIFGGNPGWLGFTAVFSAGLLVLIPLFELLLGLFGRAKTKSPLTVTLWSVWALALIVCAGSFANLVPKIKQYLITQKPKNDFVYVQMAGNDIASLCISPLGTCSDNEQLLTYEPLCGRNVTIYDKDDRVVWLSRGWVPHNESFPYPVTNETYCARVKELVDNRYVMIARQELNDRTSVLKERIDSSSPDFPQGIAVPGEQEYWHFEYVAKD